MNKIINNMSGYSSFAAEVDGDLCLTSGFDRPRFANPTTGISGYLGFEVWIDDTPTLNTTGSGSLYAGKYYSIRLVPISQYIIHQAAYASGTPSGYAPFQTGSTEYIFDLPEHTELLTFETAVSTAYSSSTVTDSTKTWATDQWVGYTVRNEENGNTAQITANTATQLTFDTDIFTATGERVSILTPKATGYAVYAAVVDTAIEAETATWNFQEFIDYGTSTYTLTSFVTGTVMIEDEYFGPENAKVCTEAGNRLFIGGGIYFEGASGTVNNLLYDSLGEVITDSEGEYIYTTDGSNEIISSGLTEGMANGYIKFEGDVKSYQIASVDVYNQILTLTEDYATTQYQTAFIVYSDYDLLYSDIKNPHIFRTENLIEIPDIIKGMVEYSGVVIVFCATRIYIVPLETLGQAPREVIGSEIVFDSPYSIVKTPVGIFFFDGEGISMTNGSEVTSITKYKASDYLSGINKDLVNNIRGVYNSSKRRVEFYFPYGTEVTNNYGLYITVDSLNCYALTRVDCNAVWRDIDDNKTARIYHGTSGRHTTAGTGDIWEHQDELATDGDLNYEAYKFLVTAVDTGTNTISVTSIDGETSAASGWTILHSSRLYPNFSQMMIDTITNTGTDPYTYDIVVGDDWDISKVGVDDYIFAGGVPYIFGPVWTDFSSPVYNHHVRGIQIDTNGFEGILFIDHYLNAYDAVPLDTTTVFMHTSNRHVRVPFKQGAGHSYGFRIRGIALTPIQINSISRLFDTEA